MICCAFCFAFDKAGSNMAARIAMIAITTSNSISVNPRFFERRYSIVLSIQIPARRAVITPPDGTRLDFWTATTWFITDALTGKTQHRSQN
jgi:hypothetical protein